MAEGRRQARPRETSHPIAGLGTLQLDAARFPVLTRILSGPEGAACLAELLQLLESPPPPLVHRAQRFAKNLFAKVRSLDGGVEEVGVVRDISKSGVRIRFLRGSTVGVLRDEKVLVETRLPSSEPVSLEAHLVRVVSSTDRHLELAFRFSDLSSSSAGLERLLEALEETTIESGR